MIYLATPYNHDDPEVCKKRFDAACRVAAKLMTKGDFIFSPIAHTHPIAQYGLPRGWDFWEAYDREFLMMCSELWVVKMPGWEVSKGVKAEIEIFKKLGRPIKYLEYTE